MSKKFTVEGHKSKTTIDDENTQLFELPEEFRTMEEATARARECFDKDKQLGLTVIYEETPMGDRQGVKFLFRTHEGNLEEADLYWGDWECREA